MFKVATTYLTLDEGMAHNLALVEQRCQFKAHEALLVTDRGVPVVVVTAATGQASQMVEGCVMRLERASHLVRAKKDPASIDIDSLAVHPRKMVDAVAAIIAGEFLQGARSWAREVGLTETDVSKAIEAARREK